MKEKRRLVMASGWLALLWCFLSCGLFEAERAHAIPGEGGDSPARVQKQGNKASGTPQPGPVLGHADGEWPFFKHNLQRTGYKPMTGSLPSGPVLQWTYTDPIWAENRGPESSPIIANNMVFLGTIHHSLYGPSLMAFDLNTGVPKWVHSFGDSVEQGIWSTPAYYNGVVYAANFDGVIKAIVAETGQELWQKRIASSGFRALRSSPLPYQGVVYIGTLMTPDGNPGRLYAIDGLTGNILDELEVGFGLYGTPVLANNMLYFSTAEYWSGSGYLPETYAVNISNPGNLQVVWSRPGGAGRSTAAYYDGKLIFTNLSSIVVQDASTGTELRRRTFFPDAACDLCSPVVAYGRLYVTGEATMYAFDLQRLTSGSGDPLVWQNNVSRYFSPYVSDIFLGSSPAVIGGKLFVGAGDMTNGRFLEFNAYNGNLDWIYGYPEENAVGYSLSSPAVAGNKVVFVSAHDTPISGLFVFRLGPSLTPVPVGAPLPSNLLTLPEKKR
jgi:outer membrane protein assembly factor BamB